MVSIVLAQSGDLVLLGVAGVKRAASIGFLGLATLVLAQSLDLVTFSVMVGRRGVAAELNPLVGGMYVHLGMPAIVAAKILLIVLVGALAIAGWARGGRGVWWLVGAIPVAIAIAFGLIGGYTNAVAYLG